MRIPDSLESLVDIGVIDEVVRPLMSGKEAQVYIVVAGGIERVAKVYKEADRRSFKNKADYTDGRKVRNSRDARAMAKRSRHGKSRDEAEWRSAEVEIIYRLRNAGVRVPEPYNYMDGVLVMELVRGEDGLPAPRLGDVSFEPDEAREVYDRVMQEVVRMLCAGVVHGDLSDFNVLLGVDGPVVIDFPQAVDPSTNAGARRLLMRDVDNMHRFLSRATGHRPAPYAQEMWALYERNELTPETILRGNFRDTRRKANTKDVLDLIGDAARDHQRQVQGRGPGRGGPPGKRGGRAAAKNSSGPVVEVLVRSGDGRTRTLRAAPEPTPAAPTTQDPPKKKRSRSRRGRGPRPSGAPADQAAPAAPNPGPPASAAATAASDGTAAAPKKRRRRRRRRSGGGATDTSTGGSTEKDRGRQ